MLHRRDRQKEVCCHRGWLHADTHSLNVRLSTSPCLPRDLTDTIRGVKLQLVSPRRRCGPQELDCAQMLWLFTLAVGEAQVGCKDLHQGGQEGQQLPAAPLPSAAALGHDSPPSPQLARKKHRRRFQFIFSLYLHTAQAMVCAPCCAPSIAMNAY